MVSTSKLRSYVEEFNRTDDEHIRTEIPNASAADWMEAHVPLFECPDEVIERIYYFRWWTFRKHLRTTGHGLVISEFLPVVPWAGVENSISCAAGHHLYEARWLRDKSIAQRYGAFWFGGGGQPRRYSTWLADAVAAAGAVSGNLAPAAALLGDLVTNFQQWETTNRHACGLFWSDDDRDGMECSISGPGLRPTLNSYLFGDARAIATLARASGNSAVEAEFLQKARRLRTGILEMLWDSEDRFFKVLPLGGPHEALRETHFPALGEKNVRELLGYTPWYFNIPDGAHGSAFEQLLDPNGFAAPYGPTTAEQRSARFAVHYDGHECQWNGPSWPYATTVALKALANAMFSGICPLAPSVYLDLLRVYASAHRRTLADQTSVPWIDENLNPYTGDWISRTRLSTWAAGTWSDEKGGYERGKDYNHSGFCDLVISGLVGIIPSVGPSLTVSPLVPAATWKYFELSRVRYHDHDVTVRYDRDASRYRELPGLSVLVDGKPEAHAPHLSRLTLDLS